MNKSRSAARTRTSPAPRRTAPAGRTAPAPARRRATRPPVVPPPPPRVPAVPPEHPSLALYEKAMTLMQKGDFAAAARRFESLAATTTSEPVLAGRARLYLDFCRRRSAAELPERRRSDGDVYAHAVFEKNRGDLDASLDLVRRLLRKGDDEKVHHLAAALHAVRGEETEALDHLRRALRKNPGLLVQVRKDDDFRALRETPRFRELEEAAPQRKG